MAAYSYRALDANGAIVRGVLQGDSERQVRVQLRSQSLKPLEVKVTSGDTAVGRFQWRSGPRLTGNDLAIITRQLATLVQSGLPLTDALQASAKQCRKPKIQELLLQVRSRVQEGFSFANALGEAPRSFDQLYRATIKAGESAGYLGPILTRLAEYCESGQDTRQKLAMAMIYPAILVLVSVSVIAAMMTFVVPKLIGLFQQRDRDLPALTQMLIATSEFFNQYGLHVLILLAALLVGFRYWLKKPQNRLQWHRLLLHLPVVGDWQRAYDSARFAATLSIMVSSGVPLLEGLRISREVMVNLQLRNACEGVVTAVEEGSSLNNALHQADIFPPLLVQMVASGEASGELDTLLARAAENQERELSNAVAAMLSVVEPLMVVIMGGIVAVIVLAVLLPILDLNTLIN